MANYLIQASYTSETWRAMIKKPLNRFETVVKPAVEKLGGKVVQGWFAFGEYDAILIVEMPDNLSAAAIALAFAAGGATKGIKTTPLLTPEEAVEALKKASTSGYRPALAA